ncbi:MAG: outer membrane beta-barrel protein [Pseudomonadota bacterium]
MNRIANLLSASGIICAVIFLSAPGANADDANANQYLRVSAGVAVFPDTVFSDDNCTSTNPAAYFGCGNGSDGNPIGAYGDFGTAPIIEAAVGLHVSPWLRAELALSHLWNADFSGQANFSGVAIGQQPVSGRARSTALMVNGYVDLLSAFGQDTSPFSPYLSAGVGVSYNRIGQMDYAFPTLGPGDRTLVPSGSSTDFAWSVGAGISYEIRQGLSVDLGYRYVDRGTINTDPGDIRVIRAGVPDNFIAIGGTEADFTTNEVTLGLRFDF